MAKKKQLTIQIKGIDWHIFFQTKSAYTRMHGSDSEGITYPSEREIYYNLAYFTPGICRHELFHGFMASTSTSSSNLSPDQVEEMACELVEQHFAEIGLISDKLVHFAFERDK